MPGAHSTAMMQADKGRRWMPTSCAMMQTFMLRSNAPVKRYSPVRKSDDHRSIGNHIMI